MISTDRQTVYSISSLKQDRFITTEQDLSLGDSFYVKFSRTDKMYAFFKRIGAQIWNPIPYSIKILKRSSFRKKNKGIIAKFLPVRR